MAIEQRLLSTELNLAKYLVSKKTKLFFLALIIFIYGCLILKSFLGLEIDVVNYSRFDAKYFSLAPLTIVLTILISELFSYFALNSFYALVFSNFATLCLFAFLLAKAHFKFTFPLIILFYFLTILINFLVWMFTSKFRPDLRTLALLPLGAGIIAVISIFPLSALIMPNFLLFHFFRYAFVFTSLDPKQVLPIKKTSVARVLAFIFSPVYLMTPLPINFKQWTQDSSENKINLKAKAIIYLIICSIFLILIQNSNPIRSYAQKEISIYQFRWLGFGLVNYLYFFLFSYVNITIPIALLWWCGFNLPAAYNLPLIATTPQARWRRWNTYFYEWFFKYIYLPVFRTTSSVLASILSVFMVTFLMHASRYSDLWSLEDNLIPSSRNMARKFLFFMAHALVVFIGLKYSKFWPDETKVTGWLGVLAMFIIMGFIHGIFLLI